MKVFLRCCVVVFAGSVYANADISWGADWECEYNCYCWSDDSSRVASSGSSEQEASRGLSSQCSGGEIRSEHCSQMNSGGWRCEGECNRSDWVPATGHGTGDTESAASQASRADCRNRCNSDVMYSGDQCWEN